MTQAIYCISLVISTLSKSDLVFIRSVLERIKRRLVVTVI